MALLSYMLASLLGLLITPARAIWNPIIAGWNPDPSILRVGSNYYIATSSFESWPGVPIYQSKN
jgi:beta-xylosidase